MQNRRVAQRLLAGAALTGLLTAAVYATEHHQGTCIAETDEDGIIGCQDSGADCTYRLAGKTYNGSCAPYGTAPYNSGCDCT